MSDERRIAQVCQPGVIDPVDLLMAIEQIKLLKSRYFQAVDEKDYETITDLFTEDAVIDFSGEPVHHIGHHGVTAEVLDGPPWRVVGGAEASRVIAGAVQDIITVHQGHDPQILVESADRARGRWSLYDRLEYDGETMHGYGHYLETYVKVDGCWRFESLVLTRLRVVWTPTR